MNHGRPLPVQAVVFDVGETLLDETRQYSTWAAWLGVPHHTFSAIVGALIATGGDYLDAYGYFRSGFDLPTERKRRIQSGFGERIDSTDLYPDAIPSLLALKNRGFVVGVAGNQTAHAHEMLAGLSLPVDWLATSSSWGIQKPAPDFFRRVVETCGCEASRCLYVGDRIDNDVLPALSCGMRAAFVRRGPWGHWQAARRTAKRADLRIDCLTELPGLLSLAGGQTLRKSRMDGASTDAGAQRVSREIPVAGL